MTRPVRSGRERERENETLGIYEMITTTTPEKTKTAFHRPMHVNNVNIRYCKW